MRRESGPSWPGKDIRKIQEQAAITAAENIKKRDENRRILAERKKQKGFTQSAEFSRGDVGRSSRAKYERTRH